MQEDRCDEARIVGPENGQLADEPADRIRWCAVRSGADQRRDLFALLQAWLAKPPGEEAAHLAGGAAIVSRAREAGEPGLFEPRSDLGDRADPAECSEPRERAQEFRLGVGVGVAALLRG